MLPDDPQVQLARDWLDQADLDLRLARLGFADPELSGLVAFHCQQAAEKAFKAFLALRNEPLSRTHDLPALLGRCARLDHDFVALRRAADTLDVFLTAGRYPDTAPAPSVEQAEEALQLADEIVAFIAARVPRGGTP